MAFLPVAMGKGEVEVRKERRLLHENMKLRILTWRLDNLHSTIGHFMSLKGILKLHHVVFSVTYYLERRDALTMYHESHLLSTNVKFVV